MTPDTGWNETKDWQLLKRVDNFQRKQQCFLAECRYHSDEGAVIPPKFSRVLKIWAIGKKDRVSDGHYGGWGGGRGRNA